MISILIVDADPAIRSLAAEILVAAGVICQMGDDPGEAAQLASVSRPDGVLLALGPNLEGIEATRRIKAEWPETIVVLLTGHGEDAYLGSTGKTGADALLAKAALRLDLLATLRRLEGTGFRRPWGGADRRKALLAGWRFHAAERREASLFGGSRSTPRRRSMRSRSWERLSLQVRHPLSGLSRIPFVQPCQMKGARWRREAETRDLSAAGVYVALEPVPDVGEGFLLSIPLPGDEIPLAVDSVVTWRNAHWDRKIRELAPGCGLRFLGLRPRDRERILGLVKSYQGEHQPHAGVYGH